MSETDMELHLIDQVSMRPCLWDSSAPTVYRNQAKVIEAWDAISKAMNDPKYTAKYCKNKWRNLRDNYKRKVKQGKWAIGTVSSASKHEGRTRFEAMSFLEPSTLLKNFTKTNLMTNSKTDEEFSVVEQSANCDDPLENGRESPVSHKRPSTSSAINIRLGDYMQEMEKIPEDVSQVSQPALNITLPTAPQADEIDGMFSYLKPQIMRLSFSDRCALLMEIAQMVAEATSKNDV